MQFHLVSERIKFAIWQIDMLDYANILWGSADVVRYISFNGVFSAEQIKERLRIEISNHIQYEVQYWPIFSHDDRFMGCCGLRPKDIKCNVYEIGVHLLPEFWSQGYAIEAMSEAIKLSSKRNYNKLFAGHNPNDHNSKKMLLSLGFRYVGDEFYAPTNLNHPSYELVL